MTGNRERSNKRGNDKLIRRWMMGKKRGRSCRRGNEIERTKPKGGSVEVEEDGKGEGKVL